MVLSRCLVLLPLSSLLFLAQVCYSATYYVDFVNGNDSNSGTSKSSPWKRCPGMAGAGQNYSHASGDRFLFKGGVTWPQGCFTLTIGQGGSSDSSRDYYGVDQSWFSGSAWSRPVFDFQQSTSGIKMVGGTWFQIDNIEMKNFRVPPDPSSWGASTISVAGSNQVLITNCYIHDWDQAQPITRGSDGAGGGGVGSYSGGSVEVRNCKFDQARTPGKCGAATRNVFNVVGCEFSQTTQGVLGGGTIKDCVFHDFPMPSDPASHCNAIETFNLTTVSNCVLYNLSNNTAPILINPDAIHQKGVSRVYNCVMWNTGWQTPICLDSQNYDTAAMAGEFLEVYNCTVVVSSGVAIRFGYRGAAPFGGLTVKNCHFITDGNTPVGVNDAAKGFGNVLSYIQGNNITQSVSQAAAAGYTADNWFQPTSSNDATVNAGTTISVFNVDRLNRSRPQGGAWDVGAYEYNGTAPVPNPTPVPTATPPPATPSPTPGASASPTATVQPTATPAPTASPTPIDGLSFDATDGIVSPPFFAVGNGISQSVQTIDPTLGGRAVYTVSIETAGDYGVVADVSCPNEGSNSFFISIDDEVTAPQMIWDVAATTGAQQRLASWRGSGTDSSNEFSPKIFNLTQGIHQLILRGRESGAQINRISLVKIPSPPTNLVLQP